MEALAPSPQTTLLILLGASSWPYSPEFQDSEAFANAARRVKAYFLNPRPFGLPSENLLDLFDSEKSADELDVDMGQFLSLRLAAMKVDGNPVRDLLLYFIGHGGFVGRDSDFYLAIRRTRMDNPRASGLQMMSLADTLTERARYLRRILILDCCFAAAAFSAFQSGPAQTALEKTIDVFEVRQKAVGFPTKGTTLLCSSNHRSPSLILPDGSSTMFTKAFLDALVSGTPLQRDQLTLRDVKERATDLLSEIRNAPKPVVHSPDQSEGDVADIPFFPNPKIEEERLRKTREEKRRVEEKEANPTEAKQLREAVQPPQSRIILRPSSGTSIPTQEPQRQIVETASPSSLVKPFPLPKPHQHSRVPPLAVPAVPPKADQPVSMETPTTPLTLSSVTANDVPLTPAPRSQRVKSRRLPNKRVLFTLVVVFLIALSGGGLSYFGLIARTPTLSPAQAYATATAKQGVMFGFDAAHTRNNPYEHTLSAANIPQLKPLWSFATGNVIRSSPAVAGGVVYVGSNDSSLYAFDATCRKDCQPLWSFLAKDLISSSPAVAGGMVYVGSSDHKLYAFDATCRKDCQPLWSFATGSGIGSSSAVAGGIVYVGSWDNKLYAFDATCRKDCHPLWSFTTGSEIPSSPAVAGGIVYVGSWDNKLYAFEASCRSACHPLWSFPAKDHIESSPAVAGGVVYVSSVDKKLYAFDATCRSACQPLWSFATGDRIHSSPAVANGIVYVGSEDGKLYAFGLAV